VHKTPKIWRRRIGCHTFVVKPVPISESHRREYGGPNAPRFLWYIWLDGRRDRTPAITKHEAVAFVRKRGAEWVGGVTLNPTKSGSYSGRTWDKHRLAIKRITVPLNVRRSARLAGVLNSSPAAAGISAICGRGEL